MKRRQQVFAIAASALWAASAAGSDGLLSEAAFLGELPVVLTASRIAQSPLDAPAPVTVIDREMIRASGFTEIHDLLRLVPGFLVADWAGGSPNVVNHGMGDANSGRLQVLIDGRSVYDPATGKVGWQSLPLRVSDIERIEVVRGPNAASFGANAFLGVVNIITRSPRGEEGVSFAVTGGRLDTHEYAARLNGERGDLDWRVSLSRRTAINYRDRSLETDDGYDMGEKIRRDVFNGQLNYRLSARDELRFQLGATQGDDVVSTLADGVPPHPRDGQNLFLQAAWHHAYAPGSELALQYYHFSRREREAFVVPAIDNFPVRYDMDVQRDDVELQQTHVFSDALTGLWGLGLRRDAVRSDHYFAGQGTVEGYQWQTFGNLAWRPDPKWLWQAGAMVEKHYYTDTLVSPRVALNRYLTPNQVIRVSAGKAYRAPTVLNARAHELYTFSGGVADIGAWSYYELEPEEVRFAEIGYVAEFPEWGLGVDARLFRNDYRNYIDDKSCELTYEPGATDTCKWRGPSYSTVPGTAPDVVFVLGISSKKNYVYYNMGGARVEGAELHLDWRHPVLGRIVFGQSYLQIRGDASTTADAAEADFDLSGPMHTTSLLWMRDFPYRLAASVGVYHVDDMKWLNDGDNQPAYTRVDVKLARRLGKAGSEDELAFTIQNLRGKYPEFSEGDFVAERRAFATLRMTW